MKEKVCWVLTILPLVALFVGLPCFSFANDVDILMQKLVEKGVLTKEDSEGILQEIKKESEKQEKAKQESEKEEKPKVAEAPDWIKEIPDWVKNIKFKGDLRLRYQRENTEDDNRDDRNRGRIRLRLGAETKVVDEVKVGFGIASGSGDPRSTNQTLDNTFDKDNINIDYAFAEYTPFKWLSLIGGKFHNPIWRPYDLLWDSDITPEGAAVQVRHEIVPHLKFFSNLGFFILDERNAAPPGDDDDPYMFVIQPGVNWSIVKDINLQLAFAYYIFQGVEDNVLDFSSNTNTRVGGLNRFNYSAPVISAELGFKNPFHLTFIPSLKVFGEYVQNPDPSDEDKGWIAGLKVGHPSMKKFGDWSFDYSYRRLEKDAWPDAFADSDFFFGGTGVKGHEVVFNFGLWKNIWLAFDYYNVQQILTPKSHQYVFQTDLNFKF